MLKNSISDTLNSNDEIADKFDGVTPKDFPIAYVSKKWFFYGLPFFVDECVLVPRFDTEVLVNEVIKLISRGQFDNGNNSVRVLDLCTGSGCIAVAIAKNTSAQVFASDISSDALSLAKKNAKLNNVQIEFIQSDLFKDIGLNDFDIVVSNPPYIKTNELGKYDKSTLCEPRIALDGGVDGLDFYRKIAKEARAVTQVLALEIGHDQAQSVTKILHDNGFCDINVVKDQGGNDRVILCRKN